MGKTPFCERVSLRNWQISISTEQEQYFHWLWRNKRAVQTFIESLKCYLTM